VYIGGGRDANFGLDLAMASGLFFFASRGAAEPD
jgi:hypothetical protein